jgi:hypothetical protein
MKIENQVVSLELAKKLKELGVTQESYAYWVDQDFGGGFPLHIRGFCIGGVSAFTVAELGEMLPQLTNYRIWQQHSTDTSKMAGKWAVTVNDVQDDKFDEVIANTEADARAKILIYLIENGLVSVSNL